MCVGVTNDALATEKDLEIMRDVLTGKGEDRGSSVSRSVYQHPFVIAKYRLRLLPCYGRCEWGFDAGSVAYLFRIAHTPLRDREGKFPGAGVHSRSAGRVDQSNYSVPRV